MGARVAGKVALVAGAGSGIGRAVCVRLAQEGAKVVVTSLYADHVEETCSEVERACGSRPLGAVLDVADRGAVDGFVGETARRFGAIDVLSSNAGIELVHEPSFDAITDEEWERLLRVNLTGAFYLCRASVPSLREGGSIITIGSANSVVARTGAAAYVASKGGLLQLTKALALELAPRGIRANCVCPGPIDTPLTDAFLERAPDSEALRAAYAAEVPLNRLGTAREVANCVLFLASDEASFVTGTAFAVDGGMMAR